MENSKVSSELHYYKADRERLTPEQYTIKYNAIIK